MEFDDPDEKDDAGWNQYMLTNGEATQMRTRLRMLQGIFSLDEMVAREVMGATDRCLHGWYQWWYQRNHWKVSLSKTFHGFIYDDDKDNVIGLIHTKRLLNRSLSMAFDNGCLKKDFTRTFVCSETILWMIFWKVRNTQNQMANLLDEYDVWFGYSWRPFGRNRRWNWRETDKAEVMSL